MSYMLLVERVLAGGGRAGAHDVNNLLYLLVQFGDGAPYADQNE